MKKAIFAALMVSLLLAALTACGGEQPAEPEPAPQEDQVAPETPEPPPEPPADAEPEPEPAASAEPEPEPENPPDFIDCDETVYATDTVNLRSGPGTDYEKVGSLKAGESAARTGTGVNQSEGWSRIELSDGTEVYVNNGYISATKPVVQTAEPAAKSSGSSGSSAQQQAPAAQPGDGTSGGGNQARPGQGISAALDYDSGNNFEEGANIKTEDPEAAINMG